MDCILFSKLKNNLKSTFGCSVMTFYTKMASITLCYVNTVSYSPLVVISRDFHMVKYRDIVMLVDMLKDLNTTNEMAV